jgi:hypothetical protein
MTSDVEVMVMWARAIIIVLVVCAVIAAAIQVRR